MEQHTPLNGKRRHHSAVSTKTESVSSNAPLQQSASECKLVEIPGGLPITVKEHDLNPWEDRWLLARLNFLFECEWEETEERLDDPVARRLRHESCDYYSKFIRATPGARPVYRFLTWRALVRWMMVTTADVRRRLKELGYRSKQLDDEPLSQVDTMLTKIQQSNDVDYADSLAGCKIGETRLLELIDLELFSTPAAGSAHGSAQKIEHVLTQDGSSVRRQAEKLLTFPLACGTYLGRLQKHYPNRFESEHTKKGNIWTINPP